MVHLEIIQPRGKRRRYLKGVVIKEYDKFFLIETKNYRECINKASVKTGEVLVKKGELVV